MNGVGTFNDMKGGEYLFLPSIPSLRRLSEGRWLRSRMMDFVTVLYTATAKAGCERRLQAAMTSIVTLTRAEAGCVSYELQVDEKDPRTFRAYERWIGGDALTAHLEIPYVLAMNEEAVPLVEGDLSASLKQLDVIRQRGATRIVRLRAARMGLGQRLHGLARTATFHFIRANGNRLRVASRLAAILSDRAHPSTRAGDTVDQAGDGVIEIELVPIQCRAMILD